MFEDKLRARPFWTDRPVVALSKEERDALADAVEAMRGYREEFAKRGVQTAESMAAWNAMNAALARLDAA